MLQIRLRPVAGWQGGDLKEQEPSCRGRRGLPDSWAGPWGGPGVSHTFRGLLRQSGGNEREWARGRSGALTPEPQPSRCESWRAASLRGPHSWGEGRALLWFGLCGCRSGMFMAVPFHRLSLRSGEAWLPGRVFFFVLLVEEAHLSSSESFLSFAPNLLFWEREVHV